MTALDLQSGDGLLGLKHNPLFRTAVVDQVPSNDSDRSICEADSQLG